MSKVINCMTSYDGLLVAAFSGLTHLDGNVPLPPLVALITLDPV
jgi:hypothetical protein